MTQYNPQYDPQYTPQQVNSIDDIGAEPAPSSPVSIPTDMLTSIIISMGFMAMMFRGLSSAMPKSLVPDIGSSGSKTKTSSASLNAQKQLKRAKKTRSPIKASKQTIADLNASIEEEHKASADYRRRAARLLSESDSPSDDTDTTVRLYLHIADEELHHKEEFTAQRNHLLGIEDESSVDLESHLK